MSLWQKDCSLRPSPPQDLLSKIAGCNIPIVIREDNEAVIKVLNAGYSVKLRGLVRTQRLSIASISSHLKDHEDEISMVYTQTKEQLAGVFTKGVGRPQFEDLRGRIGMLIHEE